ncbi:unnamed protein product [Polarella glacialis]|uniref:SET domain-containing protein n=1 Tax=Polarella glacialis TaxID=89957 RepID=A0A813FY10_POLGL|nr:unnamed protein product [Polarella glacialis]
MAHNYHPDHLRKHAPSHGTAASDVMAKLLARQKRAKGQVAKRQVPRRAASCKRQSRVVLPSQVQVKPSRLPGAGKGLFAAEDLPAGVCLPGPYRGKLLGMEQLSRLRDFSYCVLLPGSNPKEAALDAKAWRRGNLLRYCNGAKTASQRRSINVKITWQRREVHFVTTKAVRCGSEFLVDYGASYWRGLAHNTQLDELQRDVREARKKLLAATSAAAGSRAERQLQEAKETLEDFVEGDGDD